MQLYPCDYPLYKGALVNLLFNGKLEDLVSIGLSNRYVYKHKVSPLHFLNLCKCCPQYWRCCDCRTHFSENNCEMNQA